MWSRFVGLAACILFAAPVGLSGCAITDASVGERMQDINQSVDSSANSAILMNIVRASKYQPLNFVTLAKVSGSQYIDLKTGLPTLTFGPNLSASQKQFAFGNNILDNNASTSFDVAILGSKEFYKGLMTPLSVVDVNLLIRQGFPRELLFHLVIDSIRYSPVDHPEQGGCAMKNDPLSPSHDSFQAAIKDLLAYGATTETREELNPKYTGGKGSADKTSSEPVAITVGRLCFDPALAEPQLQDGYATQPSAKYFCRGRWSKAQLNCTNQKTEALLSDGSCADKPKGGGQRGARLEISKAREGGHAANNVLPLSAKVFASAQGLAGNASCPLAEILKKKPKLLDFAVETRSIYGVFSYLGRMLEHDRLLKLEASSNPGVMPYVVKGQADGCFALINYQGDSYCVPAGQPGDRTKQVFAILGQLVALKTAAGDLPNTPTVRVTP